MDIMPAILEIKAEWDARELTMAKSFSCVEAS